MRGVDHPAAEFIAKYITFQLDRAALLRRGEPATKWTDPPQAIGAEYDHLAALIQGHVIEDLCEYRGFVEHVAIRAERFLEIADELYEAAPIRHLTLTDCKGRKHNDVGIWRAVLDSPHLDRIHSLQFVARDSSYPLARFNLLSRC